MEKKHEELKEEMGEAWDELLNIGNRLTCISALVDPKDSDDELALDYAQTIGFAELLQDCANKISAVMEKIEHYTKAEVTS